jgi:hypothetical protein
MNTGPRPAGNGAGANCSRSTPSPCSSRALGMREQLLVGEGREIVAVQEPDFTREAEREAVQALRDAGRAALLDEHVAEARGDGDRRHAREPRGDRPVDVRLDRVMKHEIGLQRAVVTHQRGQRAEILARAGAFRCDGERDVAAAHLFEQRHRAVVRRDHDDLGAARDERTDQPVSVRVDRPGRVADERDAQRGGGGHEKEK